MLFFANKNREHYIIVLLITFGFSFCYKICDQEKTETLKNRDQENGISSWVTF